MSDSPYHAAEFDGGDAEGRPFSAPADGLRGERPWRSVPLWVSNDAAEAYFEIYRIVRAPIPALHGEEVEWRWRFCTPDGQMRASGGAYASAQACRDAIDALRRAAGGARVQQVGCA